MENRSLPKDNELELNLGVRCAIARVDLWHGLASRVAEDRTLLADGDNFVEADHEADVLDDLRRASAHQARRAARALLLYFSSSAAESARSSELNACGGIRTVSRMSTMMNMVRSGTPLSASPAAVPWSGARVQGALGTTGARKNGEVRGCSGVPTRSSTAHCVRCFAQRAGRPQRAARGARSSWSPPSAAMRTAPCASRRAPPRAPPHLRPSSARPDQRRCSR